MHGTIVEMEVGPGVETLTLEAMVLKECFLLVCSVCLQKRFVGPFVSFQRCVT